jgi:hypothetical protein
MVRHAYAHDIPFIAGAPPLASATLRERASVDGGPYPFRLAATGVEVRRGGHRQMDGCRNGCTAFDMPFALDAGAELVAFSLVGRALIPSQRREGCASARAKPPSNAHCVRPNRCVLLERTGRIAEGCRVRLGDPSCSEHVGVRAVTAGANVRTRSAVRTEPAGHRGSRARLGSESANRRPICIEVWVLQRALGRRGHTPRIVCVAWRGRHNPSPPPGWTGSNPTAGGLQGTVGRHGCV